MKTEQLQDVMSWIKTTDLVEVSFKSGETGFSLATHENVPEPHYPIPASRFQAVTSPAVGVFQFSALGKARRAEEGVEVQEGDTLGQVDGGRGQSTPIKAPRAGRVARVFVESGAPVEYGQALLFLEPR